MIIGHEKIVDFFDNAIKSDSLAHAYCFIGCDQSGKRTVVKYLASKLLGVSEDKIDNYPDYCYLEREIDPKTDKLKKNISISQTRELRTRLSNHSWLGGYQVVVVNEAELLNAESANALLKSLEEPGAKSVFFLLAENEQMLLPTIRSRCQQFYFGLVEEALIANGLVARGVEEDDAKRLAHFSWGRPGRAIAMAGDQELENQYIVELQRWQKIVGVPLYLKWKQLEDLFAEKEGTVRRQLRLQKILDIWIMLWRDVMFLRVGQTIDNVWAEEISRLTTMDNREIVELINVMEETKTLLMQNINAQLLFEKILLKI